MCKVSKYMAHDNMRSVPACLHVSKQKLKQLWSMEKNVLQKGPETEKKFGLVWIEPT